MTLHVEGKDWPDLMHKLPSMTPKGDYVLQVTYHTYVDGDDYRNVPVAPSCSIKVFNTRTGESEIFPDPEDAIEAIVADIEATLCGFELDYYAWLDEQETGAKQAKLREKHEDELKALAKRQAEESARLLK